MGYIGLGLDGIFIKKLEWFQLDEKQFIQ